MVTLFLVIAIFLLVPVVLFFMLFAKSIMTLDSVTIAGVVALELYMTKKVHPAFCILAGIAAFFLIAAIYTSRIAFWILTVLSVINWGCTLDSRSIPSQITSGELLSVSLCQPSHSDFISMSDPHAPDHFPFSTMHL